MNVNSRRRQPTVMYEKSTTPEGVEYPIRSRGGRYLLETYRGFSPPVIHIQCLQDWLPASRLRYNVLDPRFRGDDILVGLRGNDQSYRIGLG